MGSEDFRSFVAVLMGDVFGHPSIGRRFLVVEDLIPLFNFSVLVGCGVVVCRVGEEGSLQPAYRLLCRKVLYLRVNGRFEKVGVEGRSLRPHV